MKKEKGKYYKVLGRVQVGDGPETFYLLCYTSNMSACKREYTKNGWHGRDILFQTLYRKGV